MLDDTIFTSHPHKQTAMTNKDESAPPFSLDRAQAVHLLERLITDAAYRDRFSEDPAAALAHLGHDAALLASSGLKRGQLPDKDVLEKALAQLRQGDAANSTIAMTVLFFLEANKVEPEDGNN